MRRVATIICITIGIGVVGYCSPHAGTNQFVAYAYNKAYPPATMWAVTGSGSLYEGNFAAYPDFQMVGSVATSANVVSMFAADDGSVYVGTDNGGLFRTRQGTVWATVNVSSNTQGQFNGVARFPMAPGVAVAPPSHPLSSWGALKSFYHRQVAPAAPSPARANLDQSANSHSRVHGGIPLRPLMHKYQLAGQSRASDAQF